jgi:hypothetical protein
MVRQADAVMLVADLAEALARRGHDVQLDQLNGVRLVRLVRLGSLMLADFGIGDAPAEPQEPHDAARV